jgi:orotidine-5'-phosphate decarboxylase
MPLVATRSHAQTSSTIPARERLIVALDVPSVGEAKALVERLGERVVFYKIGLELAMSRGYFELMDWLLARGNRVFADLKLYDIPATVAAAVRNLSSSGASFVTVHAERSVVEAAAASKGERLRVLAVTVLTSMSEEDLRHSGIQHSVADLTALRARVAMEAGCDGVIASGLEAADLRAQLGPQALIVTPGIRPSAAAGRDDQKRIVTPRQALEAGADYVVVGRPIRAATDPGAAALAIQAEIAAVFE